MGVRENDQLGVPHTSLMTADVSVTGLSGGRC